MGELAQMNKTGDSKTIWDPDNEDEVEAAQNTFDDLIDKGYKAFHVGMSGKKKGKMDKFDPEAGKVIMVPQVVGG